MSTPPYMMNNWQDTQAILEIFPSVYEEPSPTPFFTHKFRAKKSQPFG